MTSCSLIFVVLYLIGLGLGDSPLVIPSLCSFVLSFVFSSFLFSACFLVLFYFSVCFSLCIVCSASVFMRQFFEYTSLLLIKKKYSTNPKTMNKFIIQKTTIKCRIKSVSTDVKELNDVKLEVLLQQESDAGSTKKSSQTLWFDCITIQSTNFQLQHLTPTFYFPNFFFFF